MLGRDDREQGTTQSLSLSIGMDRVSSHGSLSMSSLQCIEEIFPRSFPSIFVVRKQRMSTVGAMDEA